MSESKPNRFFHFSFSMLIVAFLGGLLGLAVAFSFMKFGTTPVNTTVAMPVSPGEHPYDLYEKDLPRLMALLKQGSESDLTEKDITENSEDSGLYGRVSSYKVEKILDYRCCRTYFLKAELHGASAHVKLHYWMYQDRLMVRFERWSK